MDQNVEQEVEKLRGTKVKELKAHYRELYGEESHSSNRGHLFRRIAWRLQARGAGKLSEEAQERAAELADEADLRYRAPRSFWKALDGRRPTTGAKRDERLPKAGSVLTRIHQQQIITVKVMERGFEYQGKSYLSLSAIAHHVTGARWNGFLFFGIHKRNRRG